MMKRLELWVGVGVLVSVGLLPVEQGFARDPEPATVINDGAPRCSNATLRGRYLFSAPAIIYPPAFGVTETAAGNAAGYHLFNGNGTGNDYVTLTINGVVFPINSPVDIQYHVNGDCTGHYEVLPLGQGPTFNIFVSPTGDEMTAINTEGLSSSSYTPSRRVWPITPR